MKALDQSLTMLKSGLKPVESVVTSRDPLCPMCGESVIEAGAMGIHEQYACTKCAFVGTI
jgi:predicted RNA-binding Zn-ribbon protein involved in translation (DUF1610 family)